MRPLSYPLLADENVPPAVSEGLRKRGFDLLTVIELGLGGTSDAEILERAVALGRVVLTMDSDFGTLAIRTGAGYLGIIYIRPGHRSAAFTLETLEAVAAGEREVVPPFLLVANRRGDTVRIRLRGSLDDSSEST